MYDAPTQPLESLERRRRRRIPRPGVRQRRMRAWRRALRRPDLPAPAILLLTRRVLTLQDAFGPDTGA